MANNHLIAKNTIFLYVRMLLSMGIYLYTTRVVLSILGVEDYGIYNVVGGLVAMFSFLNATMSGATSRFITFELGKNSSKLQTVFSVALTIHIIIALIVFLIGETFGVWFLENELTIPATKMYEAKWLLQFSIMTMIFSFTQVPYNASIIAHEKMNVYAYFELVNVGLKLLSVYLLLIIDTNKLIFYGAIVMLIQIGVTLLYRLYCINKWEHCKFKLSLDREFLRPLLSYSGWDLFGNASLVARTQGVNILLNIFFGAVMNAAAGIAMQVQTAAMSFATNVMTAFRPQIVKTYATKSYNEMINLISLGSIITYVLYLIIVTPLIFEMDFILHIWLKEVPNYTVCFCQLALLMDLFSNSGRFLMIGIDATGRIKETSLLLGCLYLLVIPISYVLFKYQAEPYTPYIYNLLTPLLAIPINLFWLHKYISKFSPMAYFRKIIVRLIYVTFISLFIGLIIRENMDVAWVRLFMIFICCSFSSLLLSFYICLSHSQRTVLLTFIKSKLNGRKE
ncbi:polysaccharide biosynthesis protein [Bacteroides clarus]|uniref:Polysaccharide biosynthesis protein n=1 Tax=Bacteroides clarus TaxID=626929 RepID=A0A1Y3YUF4_9BACE|nr:polysaccharide biosynthesis protein [Bacteroides clarus]OUO01456.1 hypothetical protein B5F97_07360 [Bacteroides clarus]